MAKEPTYHAFIDASPSRRATVLAAAYAALLALLAILTLSSYSAYRAEVRKSRDTVAAYNARVNERGDVEFENEASLQVVVQIAVMDFDPIRGVLKLNSRIRAKRREGNSTSGNSTSNDTAPTRPPAVNATVLLGSWKTTTFSTRSTVAIDQDVSVLVEGDAALYPFDRHEASIPYAATATSDVLDNPDARSLRWAAFAYAQVQNWRFFFSFVPEPGSPIVMLEVRVERPPTTKIFSLFIACLMWALTLAVVTIAGQVALRDRELAANHLSVMASLLFAMPSVRNTQPQAPPIGTVMDSVVLVWCMIIIASCAVFLMITYVRQGKTPVRPAALPLKG